MSEEYTINMKRAKNTSRHKRAIKLIRVLRSQVARLKRTDIDEVKISSELNELIWSKGIRNFIPKLRVNIVTNEEGSIVVELPSKENISEEKQAAEQQENKEQTQST